MPKYRVRFYLVYKSPRGFKTKNSKCFQFTYVRTLIERLETDFETFVWAWIGLPVGILIPLQFVTAPFGRHQQRMGADDKEQIRLVADGTTVICNH